MNVHQCSASSGVNVLNAFIFSAPLFDTSSDVGGYEYKSLLLASSTSFFTTHVWRFAQNGFVNKVELYQPGLSISSTQYQLSVLFWTQTMN